MTTKIAQDIMPQGIASAYAVAPFDQALKALAKAGYTLISLEENARLRMQEGKDAFVSQNGNWTREGVIYVPGKGAFLTRNSPILANAKKATDWHRRGQDFCLTDNFVAAALEDAVEIKACEIPTNRFGEDGLTKFAFGDTAKAYGEFLREVGIDKMPVYTAQLQDKPFARQMWFGRLVVRSVLDGDGYLHWGDDRVRGVRRGQSAAGAAPGIEVYTPNQLSNALKRLKLQGLEDSILTNLRNQ